MEHGSQSLFLLGSEVYRHVSAGDEIQVDGYRTTAHQVMVSESD